MTNDKYLFRGFHKCDDGNKTIYIDGQAYKGKWVYGYVIEGIARCVIQKSIAQYPQYEVIPETIGQYTGLEDINGKKIFENDYLKFKVFGKDSEGYVSYYIGQFYIVDCGGYSDYNFLIYTDMEVTRTKFDKEVKDNE